MSGYVFLNVTLGDESAQFPVPVDTPIPAVGTEVWLANEYGTTPGLELFALPNRISLPFRVSKVQQVIHFGPQCRSVVTIHPGRGWVNIGLMLNQLVR